MDSIPDLQEMRELMQFVRQFRQQGQQSVTPGSTPAVSIAPPTTPANPPPSNPQTPVAQTGENERQVPETPIIHRYQPQRAAPLPLTAPASYQPFLGMATLAPSASTLNTGHANQQRMTSASTVLPRGPSLVRRRARTAARHPPSLVRRPGVDQCFVEDAAVPTIRVTALVYPPHDPEAHDQDYFVFRLLASDFIDQLDAHDLVYRYELPLTTRVNELLQTVVDAMTASRSGYIFHAARRAHAATPITTLQPLALISKGRVYNNQVRARVQPILPDMTVGNLAADRNRFAGDVCFADGRFIIRLAVMAFPLISVENGRRHTCISSRIYSLFPRDADGMGPDLEDTSGGESTEDDEVARQLWPVPQTTRATVQTAGPSNARATRPTVPTPRVTPPLVPTRPVTPFDIFTPMPLPPAIWDENSSFVTTPSGAYSDHLFLQTVFQAATRGVNPRPSPLRVRGRDLDAAADHFSQLLDIAGENDDYTDILVSDRAFGLSRDIAVGEGLEREVMWTVLRRFLMKETTWFHKGAGECLTLRTLFPASIPVPRQRLVEAKRLGAICGLLMVFGQFPAPISPAIFQYIVHGGNFHSLHEGFVGEWWPGLRAALLQLIAMGPEQDLTELQSHLITWLDAEVSTYQDRDLVTHQALGVVMLFKPTLADTTFDHPVLKAFAGGLLLPCRNGWDFGQAIRDFEGGSDTFFSLIATTRITSADSIVPHLESVGPVTLPQYVALLQDVTGDVTITFDMVMERFLRGTGTPCPIQFHAARGAFHPMIDLSRIDSPAFRPQVLVWAATGSPFIDPTQGRIFLGPIATDDPGYATPQTREAHIAAGTCVFRTCLRTARYPVEHVLHLAAGRYAPESEPADFQEAFDFWFLRQALLAIGRHSMF
ncbi:hypothetical protein DFH06DRAFT_772897 [Mycena polygramma]|nr:hypothetical protein DFH06DRAFT_772897 [Mycena polygramma]